METSNAQQPGLLRTAVRSEVVASRLLSPNRGFRYWQSAELPEDAAWFHLEVCQKLSSGDFRVQAHIFIEFEDIQSAFGAGHFHWTRLSMHVPPRMSPTNESAFFTIREVFRLADSATYLFRGDENVSLFVGPRATPDSALSEIRLNRVYPFDRKTR